MVIDERLHRIVRDFMLGISIGNLVYYGVLSVVFWGLFCTTFRKYLGHRKISPRDPGPGQIRREVWQSLRSISIWGAINLAIIYANYLGYTRFYASIDEYGWGWFALSIAVMVCLHDAYFYWTHRLMHHPRLYRLMHRDHHLSTSPTVWGSYAFGPLEAILQAGICPLFVFTLPIHPAAYASFMALQIGFTVAGHCGHEIFPRWVVRHHTLSMVNTVTQHTLHHEKFRCCFGLYFNIWDWLMGTNHADYVARFEQSTAPSQEAATASQPEEPRVESVVAHREVALRKAG